MAHVPDAECDSDLLINENHTRLTLSLAGLLLISRLFRQPAETSGTFLCCPEISGTDCS